MGTRQRNNSGAGFLVLRLRHNWSHGEERRCTPPSQTWRTFLATHAQQLAAADFFVAVGQCFVAIRYNRLAVAR
jgi:hypothetical protein